MDKGKYKSVLGNTNNFQFLCTSIEQGKKVTYYFVEGTFKEAYHFAGRKSRGIFDVIAAYEKGAEIYLNNRKYGKASYEGYVLFVWV